MNEELKQKKKKRIITTIVIIMVLASGVLCYLKRNYIANIFNTIFNKENPTNEPDPPNNEPDSSNNPITYEYDGFIININEDIEEFINISKTDRTNVFKEENNDKHVIINSDNTVTVTGLDSYYEGSLLKGFAGKIIDAQCETGEYMFDAHSAMAGPICFIATHYVDDYKNEYNLYRAKIEDEKFYIIKILNNPSGDNIKIKSFMSSVKIYDEDYYKTMLRIKDENNKLYLYQYYFESSPSEKNIDSIGFSEHPLYLNNNADNILKLAFRTLPSRWAHTYYIDDNKMLFSYGYMSDNGDEVSLLKSYINDGTLFYDYTENKSKARSTYSIVLKDENNNPIKAKKVIYNKIIIDSIVDDVYYIIDNDDNLFIAKRSEFFNKKSTLKKEGKVISIESKKNDDKDFVKCERESHSLDGNGNSYNPYKDYGDNIINIKLNTNITYKLNDKLYCNVADV